MEQHRFGRWIIVCLALLLAISSGACGLVEESPPTPTPTPNADNLLYNAGFESGTDPWIAPEGAGAFDLADGVARTGTRSASLTLDSKNGGLSVVGAMQQLRPTFPELISGYYYVESWPPAGENESIEFVVAVHGGDFGDDRPVHELRFPLAGLSETPEGTGAGFQFLSRADPQTGKWTYFAYPVNEAFQRVFGRVPVVWEGIDVRFEVRPASDASGAEEGRAVVYFDDLYAGPLTANPNHIGE